MAPSMSNNAPASFLSLFKTSLSLTDYKLTSLIFNGVIFHPSHFLLSLIQSLSCSQASSKSRNCTVLHDLNLSPNITKFISKLPAVNCSYVHNWDEVRPEEIAHEGFIIFAELSSILLDISVDKLLENLKGLKCNVLLLVNQDTCSKYHLEKIKFHSSQVMSFQCDRFRLNSSITLTLTKNFKNGLTEFYNAEVDSSTFKMIVRTANVVTDGGLSKIIDNEISATTTSIASDGSTYSQLKPHKDDTNSELSNITTTFKLSLTEREEQSRAKVELPYVNVKIHPKATSLSNSNTNQFSSNTQLDSTNSTKMSATTGAKIFYEVDKEDDFDYEDPDDDLDI